MFPTLDVPAITRVLGSHELEFAVGEQPLGFQFRFAPLTPGFAFPSADLDEEVTSTSEPWCDLVEADPTHASTRSISGQSSGRQQRTHLEI